jgi:two-component system response regulator ResD
MTIVIKNSMIIKIDPVFPQVIIDGKEIYLSKKEFELFLFLWRNKGKICTREILLTNIWGMHYFHEGRVTDIAIVRLRKKLFNTSVQIQARKGFGYILS